MTDETKGIVNELQKWLNKNIKKEWQISILKDTIKELTKGE